MESEIGKNRGVLRLRPNYVRRFYIDGGRLGLGENPGDTLNEQTGLYIPERWIASSVTAANVHPIEGEGLSYLDLEDAEVTLKEALSLKGDELLGEDYNHKYEGEFRVLTKILDGNIPIVFHFHATDEQIKKLPQYFKNHKFGKDEAYYFLKAPKGITPYTHFGLYEGITVQDLLDAFVEGGERILEYSPFYLQRYEEGFFTPSGVPHRPGTALALEVQQPSDVSILLEKESGGEILSPEQIHPGMPNIEAAMELIDFASSTDENLFDKCRLIPFRDETGHQPEGGEEDWIFPPKVSPKFSGKRLRVTESFESQEKGPYTILVWSGEGKLDEITLKTDTELFVGAGAATRPHLYTNTGSEQLELFKIFPPGVN